MSDPFKKARDRSKAVVNAARDDAKRFKAAFGGLSMGADFGMDSLTAQARYKERYALFQGTVYAAVNAIASEGASQPVCVGYYADRDDGGPEKATKARIPYHKLQDSMRQKAVQQDVELLPNDPWMEVLERPNPIQDRWQFTYMLIANLCLTGWCYIIRDNADGGREELFAVPTTWITPCGNDENGKFSRFQMQNPKKPAAEPVFYDADQVAFAYLPNPSDPLAALAPAASQMNAIRADDHIWTSREMFFSNGVFPSCVVTVGKRPFGDQQLRPTLSGAQRRQVYSAIKRVSAGVANFGNPAIVDGLIENIEPLSMNSTEMGWEKSEESVKAAILSAFCVHPFILGESIPGSYSQSYNVMERFYKRVNTYIDLIGCVITNFVNLVDGSNKVVWWEKCEARDPSHETKMVIEGRKNGDLTTDEYRARLGYGPMDEVKEKRSKLLESVGGLSGVVSMQQAVGRGEITPAAAAASLALFLEIEVEDALNIVGEQIVVEEPEPVVEEDDEEKPEDGEGEVSGGSEGKDT